MSLASSFYVTGGTLNRDALCYVSRQADTDLYEGLIKGKFCYVLTSRQMGKSSLMVRTAARLRTEGVKVAVLDLTAIGQNLSAEQWYDGLLGRIGQQLAIDEALESFWMENQRMGPLLRWTQAIRDVVLAKYSRQVVIFIDEIDAVRSLPFSTDEFFAAIREFHNRRSEDTELRRLTFCLLGVAAPSDLISNTQTTPFNIGERVELSDFAEDEATPLLRGLRRRHHDAVRVLGRILYWTGGHPYLTQRLCQAVAIDLSVTSDEDVDWICESLFLSSRARQQDDNLLFVRERLLRGEGDRTSLLYLYGQVRNREQVEDDETNPLVGILLLSGIAEVVDGVLYVRNRIYDQVFDSQWVQSNIPEAELIRERAAYRKGFVSFRSVVIAIVVIGVLLTGMAFYTAKSVTALLASETRYFDLQREVERLRLENSRVQVRKDKQVGEFYLRAQELQIELEESQRTLNLAKRRRSRYRRGN